MSFKDWSAAQGASTKNKANDNSNDNANAKEAPASDRPAAQTDETPDQIGPPNKP